MNPIESSYGGRRCEPGGLDSDSSNLKLVGSGRFRSSRRSSRQEGCQWKEGKKGCNAYIDLLGVACSCSGMHEGSTTRPGEKHEAPTSLCG